MSSEAHPHKEREKRKHSSITTPEATPDQDPNLAILHVVLGVLMIDLCLVLPALREHR